MQGLELRANKLTGISGKINFRKKNIILQRITFRKNNVSEEKQLDSKYRVNY